MMNAPARMLGLIATAALLASCIASTYGRGFVQDQSGPDQYLLRVYINAYSSEATAEKELDKQARVFMQKQGYSSYSVANSRFNQNPYSVDYVVRFSRGAASTGAVDATVPPSGRLDAERVARVKRGDGREAIQSMFGAPSERKGGAGTCADEWIWRGLSEGAKRHDTLAISFDPGGKACKKEYMSLVSNADGSLGKDFDETCARDIRKGLDRTAVRKRCGEPHDIVSDVLTDIEAPGCREQWRWMYSKAEKRKIFMVWFDAAGKVCATAI